MSNQPTDIRPSSTLLSPRIDGTAAPSFHGKRKHLAKFLSIIFKRKSSILRSHMFVMESIAKNHKYKIDVLSFSGKRSELTVVRSCVLNDRELNIVDHTNEVSMKIMMDLEKQDFTLTDCRSDCYYRFSKVQNYYVFSQIQFGEEIPLAQVIPKHFLTKADVIWIRLNDDFGEKVAELSRPLFNRYRWKYGVDNVMAWFSGDMKENVAVGLQLCFMCVPRYLNRTRF